MLDYKKLGLKVGLEIHKQVESHKLFCHCPSELRDSKPDFTVKRELRAVASEAGEQDRVALFEKEKKRHAVYEGYNDVCCLVELDEEPIHSINEDALEIVLQVCKMLHMNIVDEVQVMRKQVLDYSNTSGFQRTALLGYGGYIETENCKVGVQSICIEEDAARKIKDNKDYVVYRLDRLGIPLIEIATNPDMHTPEHAQEVASYLGMMLKSVGRFKSGIGTIRQDVNVSISGHSRVELKGVQDLRMMPKIIDNEIKRQLKNIDTGETCSEVRNVKSDGTSEFLRPMPGASRMYVETDHPSFSIDKLYHDVEVPTLLTEKYATVAKKYGITVAAVKLLVAREQLDFFTSLLKKYKTDASFVVQVLVDMPKEIHSRYFGTTKGGVDTLKIREKDYDGLIKRYVDGSLGKEAIFQILLEISKGGVPNMDGYRSISDAELEKEIKAIITREKGAPPNAIMGKVMKKYRGKVDGGKAMLFIKKYLK